MRKKVYSQLIAPFKRVTCAPLELDFKFKSVESLKAWAAANAHIIHAGLLKIVEDENTKEYDYYSFKEIESTSCAAIPIRSFELVRLFSINDIDKITDDINHILEQITAIWGVNDPDNIDEALNSILKIAERIKYINERIKELKGLHQTDKAIIGYTGDDLIEYLTTLKYNSITVINNALDDFLNKNSEKGQAINTWKDLQDFLVGYTNDQTLKDVLLEITGGKLDFVDSDTVSVEVLPLKERIQVKHSVKLGSGVTDDDLNNRDNNFIVVKNGGLFYNLSIHDTGKALRFKCNGNIVHIYEYSDIIDKKIEEQTEGLVDIKDVFYDQANEQLVIIFDTRSGDKIVRIPMSIIIREWETVNIKGEPVKLELTPAAGDGKDKLKAILQVSTEPDNIVEKKDNGLYVSGDARSHSYGDTTVSDALDKLKEADNSLTEKIKEESSLVDEKLGRLKEYTDHVFDDKDVEFNQKIKDVNDSIETLGNEIDQRITQEVHDINVHMSNELDRLDARDNELDGKIDANKLDIETKLNDSHASINSRITEEVAALDKTIADNKKVAEEALELHKQAAKDLFDAHEESNNDKFGEIDGEISGIKEASAADKEELQNLVSDTEAKIIKQLDESYDTLNRVINTVENTLNETIEANKQEVDANLEALKRETSDTIMAVKEEILETMNAMKTELLAAIKTAVDEHVSEHHTWVEPSKDQTGG